MIKQLLIDMFTMRREKIPAWRKRWDMVNIALTAIVIAFILWTTFR